MIMATVLFATAISAKETNKPIPSFALFLPTINFCTVFITQSIPPSLVTICAIPPVRRERTKISVMFVKPL